MNKMLSFLATSLAGACLTTSSAWAAFTVDLTTPTLSSTFYAVPNNDVQHIINADYARGSTPPNDMIVQTISGGNSIRLKVLLPPGTKQAVIRGESNDWIGSAGQQPVMGIISQDITGSCPTTTDNLVYTCMGVPLQPPAGGLSAQLYVGNILTAPKYVNFILHNPGSNTFSFSTLSIAIQINDVAAYKTWRNARPWAGGATSNSVDGIGGDTTGTNTGNTGTNTGNTGTTTGCPSGAALMPTISADLTLTIPRLKFLPGGFPGDMKVLLKPVRDPNDPSQIVFELMSLGAPDFAFLPC